MSRSRELAELLGFPYPDEKANPCTVLPQNTGPGIFDTTACFMDGDENSWLSIKYNDQRIPDIKIILAYSLDRGVEIADIRLISDLISHFKTYVITNFKQPLSKSKPLPHYADYFTQRENIPYATKADIQAFLAAQGIADEYIILDYVEYHELVKNYARARRIIQLPEKLMRYERGYFDLSNFVLDNAIHHPQLAGIDSKTINTIRVHTVPSRLEIQWITNTFPQLQCIEILAVGCSRREVIENSFFLQLADAANYKINFLQFENNRNDSTAIVAASYSDNTLYSRTNSIEIVVNPSEYTMNLATPMYENNLSIKISGNKTFLQLPKSEKSLLEDLEIKNCIVTDESMSIIKKLKRLKLVQQEDSKNNSMIISQGKELKYLELNECNFKNTFGFYSSLPELETLMLCHTNPVSNEFAPLQLESDNYPKLRSILLTNARHITGVVLSELPELREIIIEDCPDLNYIEMKELPNLRRLLVRNCRKLDKIINEGDFPLLTEYVIPPFTELVGKISIPPNINLLAYSKYRCLRSDTLLPKVDSCEIDVNTISRDIDDKFAEEIVPPPSLKHLVIDHCSLDFMNTMPKLSIQSLLLKDCQDENFTVPFNLVGSCFPQLLDLTILSDKIKNLSLHMKYMPEIMHVNIDAPQIKNLNFTSDVPAKLETISITNSMLCEFTLCSAALKKLGINTQTKAKQFKLNLTGCSSLQELWFNGIPYGFDIINPIKVIEIGAKIAGELSSEIDDNEIKIDEHITTPENNIHCSILRKVGKYHVDSNTAPLTTSYKATEGNSITLTGQKTPVRSSIRYEICDRITCSSPTEINFVSSDKSLLEWEEVKLPNGISGFTSDQTRQLKQKAKSIPQALSGIYSVTLTGDAPEELPCTSAVLKDSLILYCNPPGAVKLFWNPARQQYGVKNINKNEKVTLLYYHKEAPSYDEKPDPEEKIVVNKGKPLLPKALHIALTEYLKQNKKGYLYSVIYNQHFSLERKISMLKLYCSDPNFTHKTLTHSSENTLENLINIIHEHKGVCRHRSEAFMALAHFLEVPVCLVSNERHMFTEIAYTLNGKTILHRSDHGGAPPRKDDTPAELRADAFEKYSDKSSSFFSATEKTTANKENKDYLQHEGLYYQQLESMVKPEPLGSIKTILNSNKRNALIKLTPQQNSIDIYNQIRAQLVTTGFDVHNKLLYINSPQEFINYLGRYKVSDGTRHKVKETPLTNIMADETFTGIIIVNWSKFTTKEIATYKSILDIPPKLCGRAIKEKTIVVGLMQQGTPACSAFSSRNKPYELLPEFFTQNEPEEKINPQSKTLEIDLSHRTIWREEIYGRVNMHGNQLQFLEGKLFEAIKQNCPLIVYNPTKDPLDSSKHHPLFLRLLEQINIERKLYYNGILFSVSSDMKLETLERSYTNEQPPNIMIYTQDEFKEEKSIEPIYLSMQNLHECVRQLIITGTKANEDAGFLKTYQDNNIFYLNGFIPKGDWQALLNEINTLYPKQDKIFRFVLAPGASIESKMASKPATHPAIRLSNDPDFFCKQFAAERPGTEIIDLTPQMSFKDLIFEISHQENIDKKSFTFTHQQKGLLQALIQGKTVILNGLLSRELYQQLASLMSEDPHIYSNGKRIKVSGKLRVMMPSNTPHKLPLTNLATINYSFKDYTRNFPSEKKAINIIKEFYRWAGALHHSGPGMPKNVPAISEQHLKNMLIKIKHKSRHTHNPLKGIFHYDYQKDSTDYAYLNVIAKYLFNFQTGKKVAYTKLMTLIDSINYESPNVWKVLNCFSRKKLQRILGADLKKSVQFHHGVPFLSKGAIERLHCACEVARKSPHVLEEKPSPANKTYHQLIDMMLDSDLPVIFLKGLTGVGKTTLVRSTCAKLNIKLYETINKIADFLNDTSEGEKVLLLDEANLQADGTWDFLKGLSSDRKSVYYNGKFYPLSDKHKVIVTGNPENYPNRNYHGFFRDYAETLYVKIPNDDHLENIVLKNILDSKKLFSPDIAKKLLFAYHKIATYNTFLPLSIRDLENLAQRFIFLASQRNADISSSLLSACLVEFSGVITNVNERKRFIYEISSQMTSDMRQSVLSNPLIELPPDRYITREKEYLITAIEQDILLCDKFDGYRKQAVLLEGDPGLGKSFLFRLLLEKQGYHEAYEGDPRPDKSYYQISAGDYSAHETLKKAGQEGAAVILDEVNLDETLEALLNDLLTDSAALKRGFKIFATQNASTEPGRKSISDALHNRFHTLYMDKFSDQELKTLAVAYKKVNPDAFVAATKDICEKYPDSSNQRTIFEALLAPDPVQQLQQELLDDESNICYV